MAFNSAQDNGPDYSVSNQGTICLLRPNNIDARAHLESHVQPDALWWGDALVVEHRYVQDLVEHLIGDGFAVE